MILNSSITFPMLIPSRLLINIPNISEPSRTDPFLIVTPIPAPRNKPPKIAINSLSSVTEVKFSK